jgi:hypothetical protein
MKLLPEVKNLEISIDRLLVFPYSGKYRTKGKQIMTVFKLSRQTSKDLKNSNLSLAHTRYALAVGNDILGEQKFIVTCEGHEIKDNFDFALDAVQWAIHRESGIVYGCVTEAQM